MTITTTHCQTSPTCQHATCEICGRAIRPSDQLLSQHPGTVIGTLSTKRCLAHNTRNRKSRAKSPGIPPELKHQNTMAGLSRFMQARHEREQQRKAAMSTHTIAN